MKGPRGLQRALQAACSLHVGPTPPTPHFPPSSPPLAFLTHLPHPPHTDPSSVCSIVDAAMASLPKFVKGSGVAPDMQCSGPHSPSFRNPREPQRERRISALGTACRFHSNLTGSSASSIRGDVEVPAELAGAPASSSGGDGAPLQGAQPPSENPTGDLVAGEASQNPGMDFLVLREDVDVPILNYLRQPRAVTVALIHGPRGTGKKVAVRGENTYCVLSVYSTVRSIQCCTPIVHSIPCQEWRKQLCTHLCTSWPVVSVQRIAAALDYLWHTTWLVASANSMHLYLFVHCSGTGLPPAYLPGHRYCNSQLAPSASASVGCPASLEASWQGALDKQNLVTVASLEFFKSSGCCPCCA